MWLQCFCLCGVLCGSLFFFFFLSSQPSPRSIINYPMSSHGHALFLSSRVTLEPWHATAQAGPRRLSLDSHEIKGRFLKALFTDGKKVMTTDHTAAGERSSADYAQTPTGRWYMRKRPGDNARRRRHSRGSRLMRNDSVFSMTGSPIEGMNDGQKSS